MERQIMQMIRIGTIHTPFKEIADMPIQPSAAVGACAEIEVNREWSEGLKDLDGFSHIFVIYQFHRVSKKTLIVTPFLDSQPHGIFATRAPTRPNPIGLSVLTLTGITDNILRVENVDILDGTPILDIKPYIPAFDQPENVRTGWLQKNGETISTSRSDNRFNESQ
jgi:tRNA-Thr(GGU) m(6)t(6)A37 methyltransferase TsaA